MFYNNLPYCVNFFGILDWLFEALNFERRENDYEVEIFHLTESRTTEDLDAFLP